MKLLENSSFESVCGTLQADSLTRHLEVRLECYSCKMSKSDKKAFKQLCKELGSPCDLQVLAAPRHGSTNQSNSSGYVSASSTSGEEQYEQNAQDPSAISTKTLFLLISTLNASFQEYDFSHSKASEFTREDSLEHVMMTVDCKLASLKGSVYRSVRNRMWRAIDEAVNLRECSAYSYQPDNSYDPYNESGCLETFCYLFHNRAAKRIMFLSCRAHSEQLAKVSVASSTPSEFIRSFGRPRDMDAQMDSSEIEVIVDDTDELSSTGQLQDDGHQAEAHSPFRKDSGLALQVAEAM